jgi:(p)ppGpp synthase/HD superfamily hydrolase
MNILEIALKLALNAHSGQTDKAGRPYILHPLRIMHQMDTDEERAVALLHDVIEDSKYSSEDLIQQGIPENIVNTVLVLSKDKNDNYDVFIKKISKHKLAVKIKKADIIDNMDLLRLQSINSKELKRIEKYHRAWKMLNNLL